MLPQLLISVGLLFIFKIVGDLVIQFYNLLIFGMFHKSDNEIYYFFNKVQSTKVRWTFTAHEQWVMCAFFFFFTLRLKHSPKRTEHFRLQVTCVIWGPSKAIVKVGTRSLFNGNGVLRFAVCCIVLLFCKWHIVKLTISIGSMSAKTLFQVPLLPTQKNLPILLIF